MKTFKTPRAAREAASGKPYLRIGFGKATIYVVGLDDLGLDEVALIAAGGMITGHITTRHLDRLGNGNHAISTCTAPKDQTAYPNLPDTLIRPPQDAPRPTTRRLLAD
jgi:hypothetical protein